MTLLATMVLRAPREMRSADLADIVRAALSSGAVQVRLGSSLMLVAQEIEQVIHAITLPKFTRRRVAVAQYPQRATLIVDYGIYASCQITTDGEVIAARV